MWETRRHGYTTHYFIWNTVELSFAQIQIMSYDIGGWTIICERTQHTNEVDITNAYVYLLLSVMCNEIKRTVSNR